MCSALLCRARTTMIVMQVVRTATAPSVRLSAALHSGGHGPNCACLLVLRAPPDYHRSLKVIIELGRIVRDVHLSEIKDYRFGADVLGAWYIDRLSCFRPPFQPLDGVFNEFADHARCNRHLLDVSEPMGGHAQGKITLKESADASARFHVFYDARDFQVSTGSAVVPLA